MFWRKRLTFIMTILFVTQLNASEAPPASGQGGVKTPGKETEYSGAQNDEWSKAQKDLQTAKIKYENDKKILEDLKNAAELQENLSKEALAKINEATKTVKTSEANYLRFLNQYDLRFPEKGLNVGRSYKRLDSEREGLGTVDEKPQGVEAKLRRLNRNIKRQYLSGSDANSTSGTARKKSAKKQTSGESSETSPQTDSNDVTGTITIEK